MSTTTGWDQCDWDGAEVANPKETTWSPEEGLAMLWIEANRSPARRGPVRASRVTGALSCSLRMMRA